MHKAVQCGICKEKSNASSNPLIEKRNANPGLKMNVYPGMYTKAGSNSREAIIIE